MFSKALYSSEDMWTSVLNSHKCFFVCASPYIHTNTFWILILFLKKVRSCHESCMKLPLYLSTCHRHKCMINTPHRKPQHLKTNVAGSSQQIGVSAITKTSFFHKHFKVCIRDLNNVPPHKSENGTSFSHAGKIFRGFFRDVIQHTLDRHS